MTGSKSMFGEIAHGHRNAGANAVRDSHARGIPVFEADDHHVFAVYPDGRGVAIERASSPLPSRDPKAI